MGDSDYASINPHNCRPVFDSKQLATSLHATYAEDLFMCASITMNQKTLLTNIWHATEHSSNAQDHLQKLFATSTPTKCSVSDGLLLYAEHT